MNRPNQNLVLGASEMSITMASQCYRNEICKSHYFKVNGAKVAQIFKINREKAFLYMELTIYKHRFPITYENF